MYEPIKVSGRNHVRRVALGLGVALAMAGGLAVQAASSEGMRRPIVGQRVASGGLITPEAAPGARLEPLDPDIPGAPSARANQAVTTSISPDGRTLLVLTSGYNYFTDNDGNTASFDEFVFVYDIAGGRPHKTQVLRVPNSFMGLAWHPTGREFYVAGGLNDNVHVFARRGGHFEAAATMSLGHTTGLGLDTRGDASIAWLNTAPLAGGLAVNRSGNRIMVANLENDSISLVDVDERRVIAELDLRPGTHQPARPGKAGGEFPLWVAIKGDTKAYVSSLRDREIVVVDFAGDQLRVVRRIAVTGTPNRMLLDRAEERLLVALDNSDTVAVIDTRTDTINRVIDLNVPFKASRGKLRFTGSHPNSLAFSPDDDALFVTLGGTNAIAVVPLDGKGSTNVGLIPSGWYPNSVSVSVDGRFLYVANAIAPAGPVDPRLPNQYVLQKRAAGLLTIPMPSPRDLESLTAQTLFNNNVAPRGGDRADRTMAFLRSRIKHVIYIVKENRTYDQVLGDLEKGNGDPTLTMFPEPISPNHHRLARQFVTLDNFYCSGAVSGDGWVWSTAGRTSDFTEKTIAVNYAGRGLSYDYEGMNRNINVAQPTVAERQAVNPFVPADPNLLPGTADVAALDGPGGEKGRGYIWDAARRAGLSVRNYGMYGDWTLNYLPAGQGYPPLLREPRREGVRVFYPAAVGLRDVSDPYYREYDMQLPDFWRFREWENEFDEFVRTGTLPNLSLIELPHDHFGSFGTALDGVNTPETQMADNDYALGMIVEKVAHSPYADSTLIFVVEDDAQDGPDHVDSQRTVAFVVGPYVRQGAVVSTPYANPSMLRTIVEILGMEPMGLQVALASPMSDLFDIRKRDWSYDAVVPDVLRTTQLPLPSRSARNSLPASHVPPRFAVPAHPAEYWVDAMRGQDFNRMDNLDTDKFNEVLWSGLMGAVPYPSVRHGRDLSGNRSELLKASRP